MTTRKRTESKKAEKPVEAAEEHPETAPTPTTEEVYAGYTPPATPDQVEVRVNGKIVFYQQLYGTKIDTLSSGGVSVKGSSDAPKASKKSEDQGLYNPAEQESTAAMAAQPAPVPQTDPEYTEALNESATPDEGDE
jgi:hypothetical protein